MPALNLVLFNWHDGATMSGARGNEVGGAIGPITLTSGLPEPSASVLLMLGVVGVITHLRSYPTY